MRVRAPASTANLGPGFDCFGLALEDPFDVVEVERSSELTVEVSGPGAESIPTRPEANTAGVVATEMLRGEGVHVSVEKGIRPSSGLGSSAASAAGAAVAINEEFGLGHSREELVAFAARGEAASAGAPHPDNVAPSVMGGFTVVRDGEVVCLEPPEMDLAVALPDLELSTEESRSVLPDSVALGDAVENVASASLLVAGMAAGDASMVGRGMRDALVEPVRAELVSGYRAVREAALGAGALGVALSGAGPSVVAICEVGDAAASAMECAFAEHGVAAEGFVTEPGNGAEVLE